MIAPIFNPIVGDASRVGTIIFMITDKIVVLFNGSRLSIAFISEPVLSAMVFKKIPTPVVTLGFFM